MKWRYFHFPGQMYYSLSLMSGVYSEDTITTIDNVTLGVVAMNTGIYQYLSQLICRVVGCFLGGLYVWYAELFT